MATPNVEKIESLDYVVSTFGEYMCGRYILINGQKIFASWETLQKLDKRGIKYSVIEPNYNIAPSTVNPIVIGSNGLKTLQLAKWGYNWEMLDRATGEMKKILTINAKDEKVTKSNLFSKSFRERRCLVPADGFYEWKQLDSKNKQPFLIKMRNDSTFMFAGLYRIEKDEKKKEIVTYLIITTEPNELMSEIHTRMPVILDPQDYDQWLDEDFQDTKALQKLLVPFPAKKMKAYPVSKDVGNVRNNSPELLEEIKTK